MAASLGNKSPELAIRTPSGETQVVILKQDRYELGRADSNDLCFREVAGLSRKHLVFERAGANWAVRDLGSTNGTFVNGAQVEGVQVLKPRDKVTAGELTVVYSEGGAPAAQTVIFVEKPAATTQETTMTESLDGVLAAEGKVVAGSGHTEALVRAGRELAGHMPLDKLFELILNLSVDAVGASRGILMTLEDGELQP